MSTDEASSASTRCPRSDSASATAKTTSRSDERSGPPPRRTGLGRPPSRVDARRTAPWGATLLGFVSACAGAPSPDLVGGVAFIPAEPRAATAATATLATVGTVARPVSVPSALPLRAPNPVRGAVTAPRTAVALEVEPQAAPLERGLALVTAARVAERLVDVGLDAWSPAARHTLGAPQAERVRVTVRLEPSEAPERARVVALRIGAAEGAPAASGRRGPRGAATTSPRPALFDAAGPLEELDASARGIALAIVAAHADALDPDASSRAAARAATPLPSVVERALALAEDEVTFGDPRRARVHFDALDELRAPHLPAFVGTGPFRAARAAGVALGDKAELAASLLERAEGAKGPRARADAWWAFVKLTPERGALLDLALPPGARVVGEAATGVWIREGDATWALVAASPPRLEPAVPAGLAPIARLGDDVLVAADRAIERRGRGGRRSRVALPVAPTALRAYPGQLAVAAPGFLGWIDPAIAQLVRTRRGVRVRALGPEGAIVDGPGGLELVRPGRDAPTWVARRGAGADSTPLHASASATVAAVAGRVLVLDAGAVELVDTYDGRVRGAPLRLPGGGDAGPELRIRWLGGLGRFGALADAAERVHLVDVLEGSCRATLAGPARPTAAIGTAGGVALGFASGDVLFVDPDGALVDRLRVDGAVRALHAWDVPGVHEAILVESEARALVAAVPTLDAARRRDVDGWLSLAARALDDGDAGAALRAAEPVAWATLGRVAEAEALRARAAERLGDTARARRARSRSDRARDIAEALPWP